MGRTIYYFGTSQQLADSSYNDDDKAAMTPSTVDTWQACPAGTSSVESKVDPKKGENQKMAVNSVNTNDIGSTSFDYIGQVILIPSTRTNYIKGSLGDIIVTDDGA